MERLEDIEFPFYHFSQRSLTNWLLNKPQVLVSLPSLLLRELLALIPHKQQVDSGKSRESVIHSTRTPIVDPTTLTPSCKRLLALIKFMSHNSPITIHMEKGIMGDVEYDFFVNKEEILQFLAKEEIDVSCMQFFIMFLHQFCGSMNRTAYGFLCPYAIQSAGSTPDERITYISRVMKQVDKKCFLAPILSGYHWMLCVICPSLNIVYWFDPLRKSPRSEIKDIVDMAFKTYYNMGGKHKHQLKNTKWVSCKCRRQSGNKECGYYVMRFMYEIITL